MSGRYPHFDVSRVQLAPLGDRVNNLVDYVLPLKPYTGPCHQELSAVAKSMSMAKACQSAVIFMCGGHVLRAGVQKYLFDLIDQGFISCLAVNGSVAIHDYETALLNATTEPVGKYISCGQFGLWKETGRINDIVNAGVSDGLGFGEALGRELANGDYLHKDLSLFAHAWQAGVPVTVHLGIGYDIIHNHPNVDGAALGLATYRDFLIYTNVVSQLEKGVVCTFGSAVMAPEIFLKALSAVRNVAKQKGECVSHFTSLVCDLQDLPDNTEIEAAKSDPRYFFRPWKTLLSRTVDGGGKSYYVRAPHHETIPELWNYLCI